MAVEASASIATAILNRNPRNLCFQNPQSSLKSKATISLELGFVTSQLSGIHISPINKPFISSAPLNPSLLQLVARRVCPFTGKKSNKANKVSFSNHKTRKLQFVNLQYKRVWWEAGKRFVKLKAIYQGFKNH